jgi:hypothetical protein
MKLDNSELAQLLNIANDLRKAKGDRKLEDLPDAYPKAPEACLVAKAFNYGCYIDPSDTRGKGIICFDSIEDKELFLELVPGSEVYDFNEYTAYLPEWINQIALDFDNYKYTAYEIVSDGLWRS